MIGVQVATRIFKFLRHAWKVILAIVIALALLPLAVYINTQESKCAFVILWMACYYIFEPISASVTSLLPIVLFPMLGIMSTDEVTPLYYKDIVMMVLGSVIIASAIEHSNLHRRIALKVLMTLGTTIRWLMVGFIGTTMFLSMWMVNTSSAALMVPIVEVVVGELEKDVVVEDDKGSTFKLEINDIAMKVNERKEERMRKYNNLRKALLLSVAYGSICGGLGTQVGTGPNLILVGLLEDIYGDSNQVTFGNWMMYAVPGMLLCCVCVFIVLQPFYVGCCNNYNENNKRIKAIIEKKYKEIGPVNFHQMAVLAVTVILVLSWIFRDPNFMRGWAPALSSDVKIGNATPAIAAAAVLLFLLPANPHLLDWRDRLLDWPTAERKVSWGVFLIFGGGFAIAEGAKRSMLSNWFALQLRELQSLPATAMLYLVCVMTALLSEAMTSSSSTILLLPVAYELAKVIRVHPLYIMMPLALSSSFAFMLPVGSPSCALVYGAGNMKVTDQIKPGIFLNVMCCAIEVLSMNTLGNLIFDLSVTEHNGIRNITTHDGRNISSF